MTEELGEELAQELEAGNTREAVDIVSNIKQNIQKIRHHGQRAESIVKGMLQHSRTSSGKKESVDLNLLAEEYLRLSYHGRKAKDKDFNTVLITDFDTSLSKVEVVPQDERRSINKRFQKVY